MTTLQFLGATRSVTGSSFLVQYEGRQVLVDCGLVQGATEQAARMPGWRETVALSAPTRPAGKPGRDKAAPEKGAKV